MFIIYGTRYVGKKNLRKHVGVCGHCGQTGELADYEARLWGTVYFIPIIPLYRKQLLDYCPHCRRCRIVDIGQADLYRQPATQGGSDEPLAVAAIGNGDLARARRLLSYMEQPGSRHDPTAMVALAAAYQQRQQHAEALQAARIALANAPHLAWDRGFRRLVRASEDATIAAESMLPRKPLHKSKAFLLGAAAAALVAVLLAVNAYIAAHRPLYVVNGLPRAVAVSIDGRHAALVAPGGRERLRIAEGAHRATAACAQDLREDIEFTIPRGAFLGRLFDRPIHVLNPFAAAPIYWARRVYAPKDQPRPADEGEEVLHVGKRFLSFDRVDHVFEDFPDEIRTDSKSPQSRRQVAMLTSPPGGVIRYLLHAGKSEPDELLRHGELHLRANPADSLLVWAYADAASQCGRIERCREFLATGIDRRPILMSWHRCLQNLREMAGEGEQLLADYGRMLRAEPQDPNLLYLYARLQQRCSEALTYTQQARRLDPANPYPLLAETYHRMALGQYGEALAAARALEKASGDAPEFNPSICQALWAGGDLEALEGRYRDLREKEPASIYVQQGLLDVLVARKDQDGVRSAQAEYARQVKRVLPGDPGQLVLCSGLYLQFLRGDFEGLLRQAAGLTEQERARYSFGACAALGRADQAELWLAKFPEPSWPELCLLAIAMHDAGRTEAAAGWRQKAAAKLAAGIGNDRTAGALLARGPAADANAALDLPFDAVGKPVVLVALIQAGADRKLLDLAEKLNCFPGFAKPIVARAIARLRQSPGGPPQGR